MKVSAVFYRDCIKAIIAAILVTKLHRSLKHIITPALKNGKYTNADKKEETRLLRVSFSILKRKDISYGNNKRI